MITYDHEVPCDGAKIEVLLDAAFGDGRFLKPSYHLRRDTKPLDQLSFVARSGPTVVGTVRFTPVHIKDRLFGKTVRALFLGPLAVSPALQSEGIGGNLMRLALETAKAAGHNNILLVGDYSYYQRFGFKPVSSRKIRMPGQQGENRLLALSLSTYWALPQTGEIIAGWPQERTPHAVDRSAA
ncbi:MAG: GNAT family N-acetyltransferase [Kordiimonadales bacterium]|nr:MAG: GNAT family N-acetyltransferase [Kordiimonadales bacterium]